jgi:alpha-glucosidase
MALGYGASAQAKEVAVSSPDGHLTFHLEVTPTDVAYRVDYGRQPVVERSLLGFDFDSGPLGSRLRMAKVVRRNIDETYALPIGKASSARDYCREMAVDLREHALPYRLVRLVVRAYNDGVAFRYEFPRQEGWNGYRMYDENTQFNLSGNPRALLMYLPGYLSSHEGLYTDTTYQGIEPNRLIEMPLTFAYADRLFVAITEAAIRNYAGMYLMREKAGGGLTGKLSPRLGQERVKVVINSFPHRTPWRVISIANRVGALIESNILTNLNDPCAIGDTSWVKPCRTTFTWWNGDVIPPTNFSPGNNFDTNKYYMDFAARNGLDAHGIYGYAETPWYYDDNFNFGVAGPHADVTRPIPCLDMPRTVRYAREKGIGLHLWVNWQALYGKLEEAFTLYQQWGVKGLMVDFMNRDDQEMVCIQEEILQAAARHHLFIQFHGSSKPSGLIRTYPNEFTREGTLNYEVCKWDTVVTADHDISIPFTRMLAGPTDYHLGGFRALPRSRFKVRYLEPYVMSTRCHMLAMYVVLENHLVSLCDTPEAYEGQPGFEVLRTVPGTWDETRVPLAELNRYVTIARRKGDTWWVGTLNNGTARTLRLPLGFLGKGRYRTTLYTDAPDADQDPNHLTKTSGTATATDAVSLPLAADGGALLILTQEKGEGGATSNETNR